jgi:site-specific recombinase XerC
MLLDTVIGEFVADLQLAGRADGTIEKHRLELVRLGRWCVGEELDWQQLGRRDMQRFARLRAELGHSARANMMCSLRTFCAWSVEQGYMAMSPAAGFKTPTRPQPLPRALTMEQVRALVAALASAESTNRNQRDRALLLTLLYAGLRCREAAGLRWSDVDFKAGAIAIEISKGNKGRAVPIHPELKYILAEWRQVQQLVGDAPVFSLDHKHFKPTRVGKIAAQWAAAAGVRFSAHILRHTFATFALRGSGDVYAVSKALGHAQLKQTEIYISADVDQLRGAIDTLPGIEGW